MTAGEAAGLAIAAGGLARPEVVFWLDCGRPVRIVDLALRLARAHGVEPQIEIVGLRPGERLHERLCREDDDVTATAFPHVMCSPVERVDPEWLARAGRGARPAGRPGFRGRRARDARRAPREGGRPAAGAGRAAVTGTFVLSFDFEDWHQIVRRRLGHEDWRDGDPAFERHVALTLDLLEELDVTATFFVAGVTAERHPDALREVAARGHEIGCHGHDHRHLYRLTPEEFRDDVRRCLDVIADDLRCGAARLPGAVVLDQPRDTMGVRDPARARLPLRLEPLRLAAATATGSARCRRIRSASRTGLWEFPIAVARYGRLALPLGGGTYWRVLPAAALRRGLDRSRGSRRSPSSTSIRTSSRPRRSRSSCPRGRGGSRGCRKRDGASTRTSAAT